MMFRLISGKKFREIEKAVWDKAFTKGVKVGFDLCKAIDDMPMSMLIAGRIPDSLVAKEIDHDNR
jgi:hypothetical protein